MTEQGASSGPGEISKPSSPSQANITYDKKRPRRPGRLAVRIAVAALILLGAGYGISFYLHAAAHESTDDAFIDGRIVPVSPRVAGHVAYVHVDTNQKVSAGDLLVEIDPRDFQARLDAARASLHAAEAAGRSCDIDVDLTGINTSAGLEENRAGVAAAEAMVQNARALVEAAAGQKREAGAQLAFAEASLEQARAEQVAAEVRYRQRRSDLKRYRELAAANTITQQKLEEAVTSERTAAADLDAARSRVATQQSLVQRAEAALKSAEGHVRQARAQVSARLGQLEQAKARLSSAGSAPQQVARSRSQAEASKAAIERAKAEVKQAALNLSYTRISAPIDGYVAKKIVEPGAFVQVGQALMAVVSPEIWVTANFKETQLTRMHPGQPALISVDTFPGVRFHGHVESIQRGTGSRFSLLPPENATGNFVKVVQRIPVKIVFDRPEELAAYLLVPGMSVVPEVRVESEDAHDPARLPAVHTGGPPARGSVNP